ncbi:disease resistance protein RPM1-like [Populus alba x Populus x berolinensis]|uniref:Disease resistance protein RPM1-like n=1 Tax=Populus alba x Populus x berolinensis TaxID=444605 RepID=A0AAD6WDM0_9ROSI|nr:disease resistance protein RPM1-like [Populus alba x Populus x berolinensis]
MADGAVSFLLDKLTTILLQKASLLGDARDKIEEIKLELESMKSFLRDAERSKEKSDSVETWVRQVREVAYEVEDIIDEFMHHKYKEPLKNGFKGIVEGVVKFPKNITSRHRISSKLQKVIAKVHEVSERSKRYGFDPIDEEATRNVAGDRWQHYGESATFVDEDDIVGMEESTEQLLGWLMEDEPRRTVISIVGMGGLGKTTLVTRVYNNHIIKRGFDCWAWISVSQTCGTGELLRSIIKELFGATSVVIPNNLGSMNYRQLVGMLIDYLHQKRYGSRIILTTRNKNVATSVGIGSRVHQLAPLQEKDAWALFCKKTFWNDIDHLCPKELKHLAKAILKKCEGLPLAIVAVGGLMCSRSKTVVEWKKVFESLNWQLSNNPMLEQVKGILLLSFNDLPFYLKYCFLFCCVFRDGYPIRRKKLIRLWIAEGFIRERKGMTLEEIAEEYLTELVLRSLIQVTETNDAGRVKICRVQDVMRELAMTISEKENFCTAYDGYPSKLEGKIRRLSVNSTGESIRLGSAMSHHLRSFFVFPTDTCSSFSLAVVSSKFKFLRVLDLEGVPIETMPGTLVELFNLRYLNLRDTDIRELPKSMERLNKLETLDVWNTYIERLPSGISKLSNLRHLFMLHKNGQNSQTTDALQAPGGIWNIRSLQTLACIEAEKELIQQVGNLTGLKRLEIAKLRAADGPKLCDSIQKLTGLLRLGVMATNTEEELQLEALPLAPLFLQKLTLIGHLNRLPPWIGSLENLTHLYLGYSRLQEDILSSIHVLSSLVFLELKKAYDGRALHFKEGWFPRLNKLNLVELVHLDSLKLEENSLPSIRELYLIRCQAMTALPQGIEHLNGLQKLHLEDMHEQLLQRFRSGIIEDQQKVQHIPTIKLVYITEQTRVVETL